MTREPSSSPFDRDRYRKSDASAPCGSIDTERGLRCGLRGEHRVCRFICDVCVGWARAGMAGDGTFDEPHHKRCPKRSGADVPAPAEDDLARQRSCAHLALVETDPPSCADCGVTLPPSRLDAYRDDDATAGSRGASEPPRILSTPILPTDPVAEARMDAMLAESERRVKPRPIAPSDDAAIEAAARAALRAHILYYEKVDRDAWDDVDSDGETAWERDVFRAIARAVLAHARESAKADANRQWEEDLHHVSHDEQEKERTRIANIARARRDELRTKANDESAPDSYHPDGGADALTWLVREIDPHRDDGPSDYVSRARIVTMVRERAKQIEDDLAKDSRVTKDGLSPQARARLAGAANSLANIANEIAAGMGSSPDAGGGER